MVVNEKNQRGGKKRRHVKRAPSSSKKMKIKGLSRTERRDKKK